MVTPSVLDHMKFVISIRSTPLFPHLSQYPLFPHLSQYLLFNNLTVSVFFNPSKRHSLLLFLISHLFYPSTSSTSPSTHLVSLPPLLPLLPVPLSWRRSQCPTSSSSYLLPRYPAPISTSLRTLSPHLSVSPPPTLPTSLSTPFLPLLQVPLSSIHSIPLFSQLPVTIFSIISPTHLPPASGHVAFRRMPGTKMLATRPHSYPKDR